MTKASAASEAYTAWGLIESAGGTPAGEYHVLESTIGTPTGKVLFAIDAEGLPLVLFPLTGTEVFEEDLRSRGVQLQLRALRERGIERRFAALACLEPRLTGLFGALADEVLAEVRGSTSPAHLVCLRVLSDWRSLLERELRKGMSREERIGLFGELWVLRRVVGLHVGGLRSWVGPNGARHDFMGEGVSLEVKASVARRGRVITIHGAEQLASFPGFELYLAFIRLEEVPAGGHSVEELVKGIADLGADRADLLRLTSRAGHVAAIPGDSEERFVVTEERYYRVDDSFPRIVAASFAERRVPPGILAIQYEVDLTGEPPLPVAMEEVAGLVLRLAESGRGVS